MELADSKNISVNCVHLYLKKPLGKIYYQENQ